jgi:hypothetical protein
MGEKTNIMRKLVIAIGLAIALGACSQSTDRSAPTVTTSAQQQVALQAAQAKVASCIPQGSLLSKEGRQKILDCVAPPAQQQALKQCVANAAAKANLATKAGRAKFRNEDLPNCVVQTQKGYK